MHIRTTNVVDCSVTKKTRYNWEKKNNNNNK